MGVIPKKKGIIKKIKCPICKRRVDFDWIQTADIPVVTCTGGIIKIKGLLSECCSTLFIKEEKNV